jgi:hypothetical protein
MDTDAPSRSRVRLGVNEGHFPSLLHSDHDEEVCCLLVALTRA